MNIKRAIVVGLSITGTIVGVGFASGREIVSFFASHGVLSFLFCFLAGGLFAFLSYLVFCLSSSELKIKSPKFDKCFDAVLFVCQIAIASAMFAGLDSIFSLLDLNYKARLVCKISSAIFCLLFLLRKKGGAYFANSILSICLLFATLIMLVMCIFRGGAPTHQKVFDHALMYLPILYVGMNIFTAYPLLSEVGEFMKTKKERIMSSLFIGIFVSLALVIINTIIFVVEQENNSADMVMVDIAFSLSGVLGKVYVVILLLCILTTLVSTIYGASRCIRKNIKYGVKLLI